MNLPFYIARRYLFSKKKHNAINIISAISVCGVALATLALVCTLSVFNGFQDMVAGLFTAFDPELKITIREGKVFDGQDERIRAIRTLPEVSVFTETLEENAMVQYKDRQTMAVIKGVEDNFEDLTAIDSILYGAGDFLLHDSIVDYGVMGIELVSTLGTGIQFVDPLQIYTPKRNVKVNMANPASSFNMDYLFSPGAVFVVNQQKYDSRYILTSLDFVRRMLDYTSEVSAVELRLKPDASLSSVKSKIASMLGDEFLVQDRYEQQADVFRIMEIEKLISYLFLTFILMIASLVQIVEMVIQKVSPTLYSALGVYLPLITTNCAVLGVAVLNMQEDYHLLESVVNGFAAAVGFTLGIVLFAGVRERIAHNRILVAFEGFPIALLSAGLMAIAFLGFQGLV